MYRKLQLLTIVLTIAVSMVTVQASTHNIAVEIHEETNEITVTGISEAILGVELHLQVDSGSLDTVVFTPKSEYEGFVDVSEDNNIILYVTSEAIMNEVNSSTMLGTLNVSEDVSYTLSYMKAVNFLLEELEFYEIPVDFVGGTSPDPDTDNDDSGDGNNDTGSTGSGSTSSGSTSSGSTSSGSSSSGSTSTGSTSSGEGSDSSTEDAELPKEPFVLDLPVVNIMIPSTFQDVSTTAWYYSPVRYVYERVLMTGTGNGEFSPELETTRGMIVQILYNLAGKPEISEVSYQDVNPMAYYAKAVSWASTVAVANGTGNNRFSPEDNMTREQLVVMLYGFEKQFGAGGYTGDWTAVTSFIDSDSVSAWAVEAMAWCIDQGIIAGKPNGKIDPQNTALRGEVAQILMNFTLLYSA